MSEIVQEPGTPAMFAAMEANLAEEMVCFGRGLPGGEVHEDPELLWFYTGRPNLNAVTRTHLASDEKGYVDRKITEMLDYYKARNSAMGWAISPWTQPANMATRLGAHGFRLAGESIGMMLDIQAMNEHISSPAELVIQEVTDAKTLKTFSNISRRGFEASKELIQSYYENYVANGFGPGKSWHHYIGWLDDKPVADSSLLLHAGIAGIYGVATVPEARRQGIGAAMTLHALREARALGYRVAILGPSKMAINIYRRIGFQQCSTMHYYSWSPTHPLQQ